MSVYYNLHGVNDVAENDDCTRHCCAKTAATVCGVVIGAAVGIAIASRLVKKCVAARKDVDEETATKAQKIKADAGSWANEARARYAKIKVTGQVKDKGTTQATEDEPTASEEPVEGNKADEDAADDVQ